MRCQFRGDRALDHLQEAIGVAPYHIVLAGQCTKGLPDGRRIRPAAGEILVLPSASGHVLLSNRRAVPPTKPPP
ncbi:cupin domain-containing protein [Pseudomonas lutea]|uniref:Cupin domain-containing protein n=1 Tax=Pseudomonas lutea TaxID=243924 RepID=A0ABR9AC81_9PSED|nr:cupin domain-containing protein [Pseudomonas lutea]